MNICQLLCASAVDFQNTVSWTGCAICWSTPRHLPNIVLTCTNACPRSSSIAVWMSPAAKSTDVSVGQKHFAFYWASLWKCAVWSALRDSSLSLNTYADLFRRRMNTIRRLCRVFCDYDVVSKGHHSLIHLPIVLTCNQKFFCKCLFAFYYSTEVIGWTETEFSLSLQRITAQRGNWKRVFNPVSERTRRSWLHVAAAVILSPLLHHSCADQCIM